MGIFNPKYNHIMFVIDGGGQTPETGVLFDYVVAENSIIRSVQLNSDQTGSLVLDIWKGTYSSPPTSNSSSIVASDKPTLNSALKSSNSSLNGWTKTLNVGDILRFNLDSVATLTRCSVTLKIQKVS